MDICDKRDREHYEIEYETWLRTEMNATGVALLNVVEWKETPGARLADICIVLALREFAREETSTGLK